ncbi:MAG: dienelactone hydrolase family protein, partial [Verrucomicrobiota bacterium]
MKLELSLVIGELGYKSNSRLKFKKITTGFVAADVRRRFGGEKNPAPHVGGYNSKGKIMKRFCAIILGLALLNSARAEIKTKNVEYKHGDATLEGFHAYDDSTQGKLPSVLIVHQWKGLGAYEKERAQMLAKLGYNVFAVDIYGKGVRPTNPKEAGALAGKYKSDRKLLRERVQAGLDELKKNSMTDSKKIAAIGYCFGGTTALELARSGADVSGVVSFHG